MIQQVLRLLVLNLGNQREKARKKGKRGKEGIHKSGEICCHQAGNARRGDLECQSRELPQ